MTPNNCIPPGWSTGYHEGYYTKVIKTANATIEINRPILDDAERARREEEVRMGLRAFIKERSKRNGF